ncbi:hypothetical protein [Nitrosomonas sp. Is37]|uniref:hypothetical protein n=1 Tax=Nitrosomonas sp. Is37 TaxID=3080535 RepID=UPI00294B82E9|nr:hypothetical protein [Nitrosomonas sp. Is37]MDV6343373.1 hypothetical protein [Nitrosomonas sp. Is37]
MVRLIRQNPIVRGELVEPRDCTNTAIRPLNGLRLFDKLTAQAERDSFANTNKARRS